MPSYASNMTTSSYQLKQIAGFEFIENQVTNNRLTFLPENGANFSKKVCSLANKFLKKDSAHLLTVDISDFQLSQKTIVVTNRELKQFFRRDANAYLARLGQDKASSVPTIERCTSEFTKKLIQSNQPANLKDCIYELRKEIGESTYHILSSVSVFMQIERSLRAYELNADPAFTRLVYERFTLNESNVSELFLATGKTILRRVISDFYEDMSKGKYIKSARYDTPALHNGNQPILDTFKQCLERYNNHILSRRGPVSPTSNVDMYNEIDRILGPIRDQLDTDLQN